MIIAIALLTFAGGYAIGNYRGRWQSYFKTRACMKCGRFRVCSDCGSIRPPQEV